MKKILPVFLMAVIFGCTTPTKKKEQAAEVAQEQVRDESINVFRHFDTVKKLMHEWNTAINEQNTAVLNNLYADDVEFYTQMKTKAECVDGKLVWLTAHLDYKQNIEGIEIYYFSEDTNYTTFTANFFKTYTDNGVKKGTYASLTFSRNGNQWKIIKETDQPSQINRAKKATPIRLFPGNYTFGRDYWADTRDMDDFAHDEVPYRFYIALNIGSTITGNYSVYSGTLRSTTDYLIIDGDITDGILTLKTIYNENEQYSIDDYPADAEVTDWHYKIVSPTELVGLDTHNAYLYSESLFLEK